VFQSVIGQGPATAVVEPLFANLIAADVEIPDFGRYAFEVLACGDCRGGSVQNGIVSYSALLRTGIAASV
jgi:hypothetical protein